jgi:hypothetical protein
MMLTKCNRVLFTALLIAAMVLATIQLKYGPTIISASIIYNNVRTTSIIQEEPDYSICQNKNDKYESKNGAFCMDPNKPMHHLFIAELCKTLEQIFAGKDILDLGTGFGYDGRCYLRLKDHMFPREHWEVENAGFFR